MKSNDKNVTLKLENLEERATPVSFGNAYFMQNLRFASASSYNRTPNYGYAVGASVVYGDQNVKYANGLVTIGRNTNVLNEGKLWVTTNTNSYREKAVDNVFASKSFVQQQVSTLEGFYARQMDRMERLGR